MNLTKLLQDDKFNIFFSFLLGIGIICMIRPICSGAECNVKKAPSEKDFDQFVYRLSDKCYSFKTETVECPTTGAIESFRSCPPTGAPSRSPTSFALRSSPILSCD
jgi:hypothetical protein